MTENMLQLIQQGILLIGTLLGGITDAKTGYIYDWITYPLIGIGIIFSIVQGHWNNLILGAVIFAVLYIVYKYGKLGGGDVKIITGIALLNPNNDYFFIATTIFFATMSAITFYGIYYFVKYFRTGINLEENKRGITKALLFGAIILIYFTILINNGLIAIQNAEILAVPLLFGLVFIALQEGIKKNFFEKKILVKEIEEDEVIAEGKNVEKIVKILGEKKLIGEKEKKLLIKKGIKVIYVMRGLPPFGPFLFIGVLGAITIPDFLTMLFL